MGARIVKFDFSPRENEQLDVVVNVPEDKRSVIHGIVTNCDNDLIKDAVVKLFEVIEKSGCWDLRPLTHTFTDEHGQFLFGPLCPGKKYAVKVWFSKTNYRELTIAPECDDDDYCLGSNKHEWGSVRSITSDEEI
jgi:hypothetical protein